MSRMTEENDQYQVVYTISPRVVVVVMVLFTVIVAIGFLPMSIFFTFIIAEGGAIHPMFFYGYLFFHLTLL